ncbi:MAG: hypothetical protein ABFC31_07195 [Clostridiaceae bacterium]
MKFSDTGSTSEQLSNLSALILATQNLALTMQVVAADALSVDPQLLEYNKELRRQLRNAQNTLAIADKQLNAKKGAAQPANGK